MPSLFFNLCKDDRLMSSIICATWSPLNITPPPHPQLLFKTCISIILVKGSMKAIVLLYHYLNLNVVQFSIFISCLQIKHGKALGALKQQMHRTKKTQSNV